MVRLTLRKANAVQLAVNELIKSITIDTSISITEFEDVHTSLELAKQRCMVNSTRKLQLLAVIQEIRKSVGRVNAQSGINDKLTDLSAIEKIIAHNESLLTITPKLDVTIINGKLNKIKIQQSQDHWNLGSSDSVKTGYLDQEQLEQYRVWALEGKKIKAQLTDDILTLNITQFIELSEEVEHILTTENLI